MFTFSYPIENKRITAVVDYAGNVVKKIMSEMDDIDKVVHNDQFSVEARFFHESEMKQKSSVLIEMKTKQPITIKTDVPFDEILSNETALIDFIVDNRLMKICSETDMKYIFH